MNKNITITLTQCQINQIQYALYWFTDNYPNASQELRAFNQRLIDTIGKQKDKN